MGSQNSKSNSEFAPLPKQLEVALFQQIKAEPSGQPDNIINEKKKRYSYSVEIHFQGLRGATSFHGSIIFLFRGTQGNSKEIEISSKDYSIEPQDNKPLSFEFSHSSKLGDIWLVELWIRSQTFVSPYIQTISVTRKAKSKEKSHQKEKTFLFPAWRWVDEKEDIREGTALLPAQDTPLGRVQRKLKLEKLRGRYQYAYYSIGGLPALIKSPYEHLVIDEQFSESNTKF